MPLNFWRDILAHSRRARMFWPLDSTWQSCPSSFRTKIKQPLQNHSTSDLRSCYPMPLSPHSSSAKLGDAGQAAATFSDCMKPYIGRNTLIHAACNIPTEFAKASAAHGEISTAKHLCRYAITFCSKDLVMLVVHL